MASYVHCALYRACYVNVRMSMNPHLASAGARKKKEQQQQ